MSLDEYVAACRAPTTVDFDEDFDLDAFSAAAVEQIGVLESIDPPEEVAAWHDAMLAYLRALRDTLDDAPDDEGAELDDFLFSAVISLAFEHGPALEGALGAMAPQVQEQLRAAGCLDDEESADFEDRGLSDLDAEGMADEPAPAPAQDPEPPTPAPAQDPEPPTPAPAQGPEPPTPAPAQDPEPPTPAGSVTSVDEDGDGSSLVVACNRDGCPEIDSRNPVTVTGNATSPRATAEPAPPPTPDDSSDGEPDAPAAPAVVHECPTTWDDSPTLTVAELLTACGGDASALAVRTTQECAAEDISAAGDQARTNAEQSRRNATDARDRAAEAAAGGNEDLAEHYEDLAQHHEDLAQHHLALALDAENREMERRDRVMASRGATTWEQACETMVNRVWAADYTQAASLGRAFLTHLAILGDLICGGPSADHTDLCGGVDLLNVLEGSLDTLAQGIESVAGLIEAATDFFL